MNPPARDVRPAGEVRAAPLTPLLPRLAPMLVAAMAVGAGRGVCLAFQALLRVTRLPSPPFLRVPGARPRRPRRRGRAMRTG